MHSKVNKLRLIIIAVISVIVLSLLVCSFMFFADYKGLLKSGEECEVVIPNGSSVTKIANILEESGVINNPLLFRVYSKIAKTETLYQYGTYKIKNDIGYEKIAQILMTQGSKAKTVTVTIPEGTGINDYTKNVNGKNVTVPGIATLLDKAGVCSKEDFLSALKEVKLDSKLLKNANEKETYYALEGYLFPDTYEFYFHDSKECAKLAIERMIKRTEQCITDEMYKRADELGYSMNEILTMASIVQMESGQNAKEMSNVAAVFYNRLKNTNQFSTLGSSPTCYYGSFNPNDDDRYDTYKIKGLPPGPLCSPGIDAIKAALYPSEKTEYFFVTDKNGKFYYHKTLQEQNATINRLQQEGNWIYEYFN